MIERDRALSRRRFFARVARRRGDAGARRLPEAVAERVVPEGARRRRATVRAPPERSSPAARRWRRNSPRPICRRRFAATARRGRRAPSTTRCSPADFADYRARRRRPRRRRRAASRSRNCARCASRTQITRHDCVEGWSAIGKWKGVQAGDAARAVHARAPAARYVVFHCADPMDDDGNDLYYESIDMDDAWHPQTILAYELNDKPLPVPTARRCGCASSGSWATSTRST